MTTLVAATKNSCFSSLYIALLVIKMAQPVQVQQDQAVKLALPKFTGTGGAKEVPHFLRLFESYCANMAIAPDNQISYLNYSFPPGSKAAEWWDNLQSNAGTRVTTWPDARAALFQRYNERLSAAELAGLVDRLRQQPNESVADFRDRVNTVAKEFTRDLPATYTEEQRRLAEEVLMNNSAKVYFLNGLRHELREIVLRSKFDTLDQYEEEARRIERAQRGSGQMAPAAVATVAAPQPAAAGDSMLQQATAFVNLLRGGGLVTAAPAASGGGGRGAARGGGRGGRGGAGAGAYGLSRQEFRARLGMARPTWLKDADLPANVCRRCGAYNHQQKDCKVTEANFRWKLLVEKMQQGAAVGAAQAAPAGAGAEVVQPVQEVAAYYPTDF